MKAFLKNYRQSPRKVRLVADLIRGKDVATAQLLLKSALKRAALPVEKLLHAAVANAGKGETSKDSLFVKEIRVDVGPTLKRIRPRARGSAYLVRKRTSRITLVLGTKQERQKVKNLNPKS